MSWGTGTRVQESRAVGKSAEFALATDRFLAPLICRVVRAVRVLGAGLGFPVGGTFGFTPPTSDKLKSQVRTRNPKLKRKKSSDPQPPEN